MNELSTNLTPAEIVFNSKKIVNIEEQKATETIKNCIKASFFAAGQVPEKEDFYAMTAILIRDINQRYKKITEAELQIAFENGVRGDYGQYFGLNLVTFNNWIKSYLSSKDRLKKLEVKEEKKEKTEEEIMQIQKEFLKDRLFNPFNEYATTGKWTFTNPSITKHEYGLYDILRSKGLCKFVDPALSDIIQAAKQMMRSAISSKRINNPTDSDLKDWAKRMSKDDFGDGWKYYARIVAFKKQIDMMVELDLDIKDYFE